MILGIAGAVMLGTAWVGGLAWVWAVSPWQLATLLTCCWLALTGGFLIKSQVMLGEE